MDQLPLPSSQPAEPLRAALAARGHRCSVDWVASTGSTNADLLARCRAGAEGAACLIADRQTAGRGRQSRPWMSDGRDLLLSVAWPLAPGASVEGLSLAVGTWAAHALHAVGAAAVRLKWPNDLLLDGAKIGGILIELADTRGARWAVVGIGINLVRPEGVAGAAGLDAAGLHIDRWDLAAELVPRLLDGLDAFARGGFGPWRDAWEALHAWAGREVRVLEHERVLHAGRALGVDAHGRLLLDTGGATIAVASGDVSLRLE